MTLPHQQITPIPNTEPEAVPSLWNTRYSEIDENFNYLNKRLENESSLMSPDPERYFVQIYGSESQGGTTTPPGEGGGDGSGSVDQGGAGGGVCGPDCVCMEPISPDPVETFEETVE